MSYNVLGYNVVKYMGERCEGHNCDFTYTPTEMNRYEIVIRDEDSQELYLLKLWHSEGECGSGWCVATNGEKSVEKIDEIPYMEFEANIDSLINGDFLRDNVRKITNSYFEFDEYGDDDYYPSGYVSVNSSSFSDSNGEISTEHDDHRDVMISSMMSNFS